jgi:hypothetical protein
MRDLIFVTCTYARPDRIEFMRRHVRTLILQIDRYHWIVVEDGDRLDPELHAVLKGWNTRYLHIGPTDDRGNAQRNLAFEYIRDQRLIRLDALAVRLLGLQRQPDAPPRPGSRAPNAPASRSPP